MKLRRPLPTDPQLRAVVKAQLNRRAVLAAGGGLGLAGLLSACGTSGTGGSAGEKLQPATDLSDKEKVVNWSNWTLYLDYDDSSKTYPTLEKFKKQTGISPDYAEDIDSNESYYGKVQAQMSRGQSIGQDIITMTDWMVARMISDGWLQELDHANIPNIKNLLPKLNEVPFDKGRKHSLTWQSGFTGLAWNKEALPKGLKNISDLWHPDLKGRVEIVEEWNGTPALVMMEHGVDVSQFTETDYQKAVDEIAKNVANGQIRQVKGNSYKEDLISGDAVAVVAYSGDITQLNFENGDKWEFAIPEAGGDLWSDNLLIPMGATHKKNAEELMNFYYQPEIAAEVAAYVNYISPVAGAKEAMEKIDPELVDNPLIFPTDDDLKHVQTMRPSSREEEQKFIDMFQKAIGR